MTEADQVYHVTKQKRELVEMLKELYEANRTASQSLDEKAWQILGVTSATFGIVSALYFSFIPHRDSRFWLGMLLTCVIYASQIAVVLVAISPKKWKIVPGVAAGERFSYEKLYDKWIVKNSTEDDFLNQLIADYAGNEDIDPVKPDINKKHTMKARLRLLASDFFRIKSTESEEHFIEGAIQQVERKNRGKALCIRLAAVMLGLIVVNLVVFGMYGVLSA